MRNERKNLRFVPQKLRKSFANGNPSTKKYVNMHFLKMGLHLQDTFLFILRYKNVWMFLHFKAFQIAKRFAQVSYIIPENWLSQPRPGWGLNVVFKRAQRTQVYIIRVTSPANKILWLSWNRMIVVIKFSSIYIRSFKSLEYSLLNLIRWFWLMFSYFFLLKNSFPHCNFISWKCTYKNHINNFSFKDELLNSPFLMVLKLSRFFWFFFVWIWAFSKNLNGLT